MEPDRSPLVLVPIFGCKGFGANTTCDDIHHGEMPEGTNCCCMVCYRSGREDHPTLKETPADKLALWNFQPKDELGNVIKDQWSAADTAEPTCYEGSQKPESATTRKQKRASTYGHATPMAPDQIAHRLDSGRARTIA